MAKALGGRPKNYDCDEPLDEEAEKLSYALVNSLSDRMKQLAKFGGEHSLTSRDKQKMASEVMVGLFMQPVYRERFADWALKNPGEAAKLAATQIPKEIHIEQTTQHNIVILPPSMTAEAWLAEQNEGIEEAEVVPWIQEKASNG
jgi:hypothetical protein